MARSFDEIASTKKQGKRGCCPRCGTKHNAGRVTLVAAATVPEHRQISARSVTLCESCTVEVFETLRDGLISLTARQPDPEVAA